MNFDMQNIFGEGFGRMSKLEDLEQSWKELVKNPEAEDNTYWQILGDSYDLLVSCTESDSVDKELIGLYTVIHDFAASVKVAQKEPLWAAAAEALAGFVAYSIVDIPLENTRSLRAFDGIDEYIIDIDGRKIIKE